jgi:hypothetical protein
MKQEIAMSQKKAIKIELTMDVYEKLVKDAGKGNFAKHISKLIIAYEPQCGTDSWLQATLQDILVRLATLEARDGHADKTPQSIDIPEFDFDATLAAMPDLEVEPRDDDEEFEQQPETSSIQDEWEAYQAEHPIELPSKEFWHHAENIPDIVRDHVLMGDGVPKRFVAHVKQMLDTLYS